MSNKDKLKTFDLQSQLPSLPLPELKDSCQRYLDSVKPFVNGKDYDETVKIVREFENGIGITLHEKLAKKASESRNWLQDWWYETYLNYRGPTPVFSNCAGGLDPTDLSLTPKKGSQIKRSALWLYHAVGVFQSILRQEFPIQYLGKHYPLDMTQYAKFYCSSRIPGEKHDVQVNYVHLLPKPDGTMDVLCNIKHVVILCRGRIFKLDIFDKHGEIMKPPVLMKQLMYIKNYCRKKGDGPSIAWFTSADRYTWFKGYRELCQLDSQNKININVINEAIVALALEDVAVNNIQESSDEAIFGDCGNRWLDKSITEIICNNGILMSTEDHIHADGNVNCGLLEMFAEKIMESDADWPDEITEANISQEYSDPVELEFVINDKIVKMIEECKVNHRKLVAKFVSIDKPIHLCAKDFAKKHKVNPDTLVQMGLQLGYYRVHKKCASVYESGTTRMFHYGRTETVRSCTSEVNDWMEAMENKNESMTNRKKLLLRAIKKHNKLMKDACMGQGFDRHFLGLRKIAEEEGIPLPNVFEDKAWKLSGGDGFILSSSLCGYFGSHGGIAPLNYDGYGTFYTIEPHRINICLTAFKDSEVTNLKEMYASVVESYKLLEELLSFQESKL